MTEVSYLQTEFSQFSVEIYQFLLP